ncbi:hypothetical protein CGRA01v4_14518 [Colletotrichum graminicola]|nr:hypothetical protein CGRA01v4_14518 [Colletotrichum graminicola]
MAPSGEAPRGSEPRFRRMRVCRHPTGMPVSNDISAFTIGTCSLADAVSANDFPRSPSAHAALLTR